MAKIVFEFDETQVHSTKLGKLSHMIARERDSLCNITTHCKKSEQPRCECGEPCGMSNFCTALAKFEASLAYYDLAIKWEGGQFDSNQNCTLQ